MKKPCILFLVFFSAALQAQDSTAFANRVMTLSEYLGFVKKHHPVVKQAHLEVSKAQAELMSARGGFDPNIEIDYDRKKFAASEYYDLLNASFTIPTWFGIEVKAGYELADGAFLNPQNTLPENGLYSAGISLPLGQGLFINQRMATLQQAKVFLDQSEAERQLEVNQILFEAAMAYFQWYQTYHQQKLYRHFLQNARIRFNGIQQQVLQGDKAAIDSVEAGITVNSRKVGLQQANIDYLKKSLELANFLWIGNGIPLELQPTVTPDTLLLERLDETLRLNQVVPPDFSVENHPKIRSLQYKIDALTIERRLKAELLKPRLDLHYNFITSDAEQLNTINTGDYKLGVRFRFPLFLRKERGNLLLARYKLQDAEYQFLLEKVTLLNRVEANRNEVENYTGQLRLIESVVESYQQLLQAEERRFYLGESSVFLINSREQGYIDARLKQIDLYTKFFAAQAQLFRTLALEVEE